MIDPTNHPMLSTLAIIFTLTLIRNIYRSTKSRQHAKSLGCEPAVYGPSGPFGLGFFLTVAKAAREGKRIQLHEQLYAVYGNTFKQKIPGNEILFTIDIDNIKAMLTSQFHDFGIGFRSKPFWPLLGDGIFNADGQKWSHARGLLRPQFTKDQVADLQLMDEHITEFMAKLPQDKTLFDIQPLFSSFTNESSTHFLFGESLSRSKDASGNPRSATEFGRAFDKSMEWMSRRLSAQKLSFLVKNKEYTEACAYVHDVVDHYVRLALDSRNQEKKSSDRYVFLQALAQDSQDSKVLRDNILNLMIAGRDTTASMLSSVLFYLSHAPAVWQRLRKEIVDEYGDARNPTGETITHAKIKNMRYLRYVLNETLRLMPALPINSRMAIRDTSLPRGGGPDGQSPIFVKEGTVIPFSLYSMHRRKDIWGADADEFRPERWEDGPARTWEYIPFNGGPRICLGQQYALIEASYMLIRLAQNFDTLENDGGSPVPDARGDLTLAHRNGVHVRLYASGA